MLVLIVPIIAIDKAANQKSFFDNRMLVEFPASLSKNGYKGFFRGVRNGLESYLVDRIAGREKMITAYQIVCDKLFNKLVHPTYRYGENGYVFFKNTDDYQHTNVDTKYIEQCANNIETIYKYCKTNGIDFYFVCTPAKYSVYGEYMPKGINVFDDVSNYEHLYNVLVNKKIPQIRMLDRFLIEKTNTQLFNVKYDAGHWNATGAFLGYQTIVQYLKTKYNDIVPIEYDDLIISTVNKDTLPVSYFKINEKIPVYSLKQRKSISEKKYSDMVKREYHPAFAHYKNMADNNRLKILLLHSSYYNVAQYQLFFAETFYETICIHNKNILNLAEYNKIFSPDILILEVGEYTINSKGQMFDILKKHNEKK